MRPTLPANTSADRWGSQAGRPGASHAWYLAAGAAVLAHACLLAMISRIAPPAVSPAPEEAGIPLILQSVQALGSVSLAPPAALVPQLGSLAGMVVATGPAEVPAVIHHAAVAPRRAVAAKTARGPTAHVSRESGSAPYEMTARAARAFAPGTVKAGADGSALVPALEARIDEAVRQATAMPEAARRQHREGRAQVKFSYVDGRVNGVQLVSSSESRLLDEAALRAVSRAAYPSPPEVLRGRHLDLLVWVNFRMEAS